MIIEVVPIIRIRRLTTWWSYSVPKSLRASVQVGSLVGISFRGRNCLGIVWSITRDEPEAKLEPIIAVHTSQPLLLNHHRELVAWLAQTGFLSLSTALYCWLPASLRGNLTKTTKETLTKLKDSPLTAVGISQVRQQAAISPFMQPHASAAMLDRFNETFWDTFAPITQNQYFEKWLDVRIGKISLVFGREGAIFAPYLNLRHCIIANAEDPSYYHNQLPYLPLQDAAKALADFCKADVAIRSSLPAATGNLLWGKPVVSLVKNRAVTLIDLHREPLINDTLLEAIMQCQKQGKTSLLLLNSLDAPLVTPDGSVATRKGTQSATKELAARLGLTSLPPTILIGTRALFHQTHRNVGLTAALTIDTQLNPQCFADEVSLWSDLGTLMAYPCPCIIQTRAHDHPLIHALRNQQFSEYTYSALDQRLKAQLPPVQGIIFCSQTTSETSMQNLETLKLHLTKLTAGEPWIVSDIFSRTFRKKVTDHLALIPKNPQTKRLPTPVVKYLSELKRPWMVQTNAWHIL